MERGWNAGWVVVVQVVTEKRYVGRVFDFGVLIIWLLYSANLSVQKTQSAI